MSIIPDLGQMFAQTRHRGKTFTHARVLVFLIKYVTRVFPLYYKQITIQVQNSSDIVLSTIISHFPEQGAFRRLQKCIWSTSVVNIGIGDFPGEADPSVGGKRVSIPAIVSFGLTPW